MSDDYSADEDGFNDLEDVEDELSRIAILAQNLDPEAVAQLFDREARKLRNPEVKEGELLDPEDDEG